MFSIHSSSHLCTQASFGLSSFWLSVHFVHSYAIHFWVYLSQLEVEQSLTQAKNTIICTLQLQLPLHLPLNSHWKKKYSQHVWMYGISRQLLNQSAFSGVPTVCLEGEPFILKPNCAVYIKPLTEAVFAFANSFKNFLPVNEILYNSSSTFHQCFSCQILIDTVYCFRNV